MLSLYPWDNDRAGHHVKELRNGYQTKWLTALRQRLGRVFYWHCPH
nr:hypothetical protein [Chroococcidiopsis cubana]